MSDPDVARMAREALEDDAKATPAPWTADLDIFDGEGEGIVACVTSKGPVDSSLFFTISTNLLMPPTEIDEVWTAEKQADADAKWEQAKVGQQLRDARFIAAARTREPLLAGALLSLIARVEAQAGALDDDIAKDERYIATPGSVGHDTLQFKNGYLRGVSERLRAMIEAGGSAQWRRCRNADCLDDYEHMKDARDEALAERDAAIAARDEMEAQLHADERPVRVELRAALSRVAALESKLREATNLDTRDAEIIEANREVSRLKALLHWIRTETDHADGCSSLGGGRRKCDCNMAEVDARIDAALGGAK